MSDPNTIPAGTRLGPYTIMEELGRGATAKVYLASDANGRPFAVKVRRRGQAEMDRRFLREFESMRLLRAPGVVAVYEAGIDGAYLWFSMDRVFGQPFFRPLMDEPYLIARVEQAMHLAEKLCSVLAQLHEAGFVHRDVKPSNVLVDRGGDVHVLDFGIGRYFAAVDTLSQSGEVLGTVPYMAPEQLSALPIDGRADLFATGLMLYEAIAGPRQRPLTTVGWIPKICLERLPPLATLFREVPRGLSHLVERLLAVNPADRPTAREAAAELRRLLAGGGSSEWPTPEFSDPGEWWLQLEGCIGQPPGPSVWVMEGHVGSGRRRIAEQLHRVALLQGTWTLHLNCRADRVGHPVHQFLEHLLAASDDSVLSRIVGEAGPLLAQTWPHLPLPVARTEVDRPSTGRAIDIVAAMMARAGRTRPLLLIIEDLEQVDRFTARLLPALIEAAGDQLGLLLIHESRWSTPVSRRVVAKMVEAGAGELTLPPIDAPTANAIAASVCPASPPNLAGNIPPRMAVEAGWRALAKWRNEPFAKPGFYLWPVAVRDEPVPLAVYRKVFGEVPNSPWITADERGVQLSSSTARQLAAARLQHLGKAAANLAAGWHQTLKTRANPADLASLWLLAGNVSRAWTPAALAAVTAARYAEYAETRQWLLCLDTLPALPNTDPRINFELLCTQTDLALATETHELPTDFVDAAERLARNPGEEQRVKLMRARLSSRQGEHRTALVTALRIAGAASSETKIEALLAAVRARVSLGQLPEALRDLERTEAELIAHPDPVLACRASNARAVLGLMQGELLWSQALCQDNIRNAHKANYARGEAFASHHLSRVLRMLGRRREAEQHSRSSRKAFLDTGDVGLDAEAGLALATLLVERGEPLAARTLLDETLHRIRALNLVRLSKVGMRVALQVAVLSGDNTDANMAIAGLDTTGERDPEAPAAQVLWFRVRGDLDRALSVPAPREGSFGFALWQLQRGRCALSTGHHDLALASAAGAAQLAQQQGLAELLVYAQLISGAVTEPDDQAWAELQRRASGSMWTELVLGAIEMDARRLTRLAPDRARTRWETLKARAFELGFRPAVEEATGWLHLET